MKILSIYNQYSHAQLIILLTVILLCAILFALAFESSGARDRDARRVADITYINLVLSSYYQRNQKYPEAITQDVGGVQVSIPDVSGIFTKSVSTSYPIAPRPYNDLKECGESSSYQYKKLSHDSYTLSFCLYDNTPPFQRGYQEKVFGTKK